MITAPVVDDDDRIVGVITIDDAMAFLEEEAEEDILRLAGVGEGSLSDRVIATTRQRFPWLAVNLVTAIFASLVISMFEDTISGFVALAVLMPIVASMGGNAGTQSLTVAVRALATRDLTGANVWRVIRREARHNSAAHRQADDVDRRSQIQLANQVNKLPTEQVPVVQDVRPRGKAAPETVVTDDVEACRH